LKNKPDAFPIMRISKAKGTGGYTADQVPIESPLALIINVRYRSAIAIHIFGMRCHGRSTGVARIVMPREKLLSR
jgi:hypothetical protein